MKKQYLARHDKAMRAVVQAFTKGRLGSFYLIADVGQLEGLTSSGCTAKSTCVCALRQVLAE